MRSILCLFMFFFATYTAAEPLCHTFSIVARDPNTGELGVAVQTHWFAVGSRVPWAEAGVGAIATQSFTEVSYGPLGLQLMKAGKTASEALSSLLASDSGREVRQVAMIDAKGNTAAHTGNKCIAAAGHKTGSNYSVQANLMDQSSVWPAMATAFENAKGDLAERMLAALEAAQKEGGDIRGKQSAAILVVTGKPTGVPWKDRLIDLRVEDHAEPLQELRRLLQTYRAYRLMDRGDELVAEKKIAEGMKEYEHAHQLLPQNDEIIFWSGIGLFTAGEQQKAMELLHPLFVREPRWLTLVDRLPAADLLKQSDVDKIRAMNSTAGK